MTYRHRLNRLESRLSAAAPRPSPVVHLPADAFDFAEEGRRRLAEAHPGKLIVSEPMTLEAWQVEARKLLEPQP